MRNHIDLAARHFEYFLQKLGRQLAHHDQAIGERRDFLHHPPLVRVRFAKNRMQRSDHRHFETPEEGQNVTARRAAKDSILVLQAYQIEVREIEKVSRLFVGGQIVLRKGEPYPRRVGIPRFRVIDRNREQLGRATLSGDRVAQVGSKSGDPTLPRKIVANNGNPAR